MAKTRTSDRKLREEWRLLRDAQDTVIREQQGEAFLGRVRELRELARSMRRRRAAALCIRGSSAADSTASGRTVQSQ